MNRTPDQRRTYAVTGASGRSGQLVARGLLAAGHRVRAVGRDASRLAPLVAAGAEAYVGNIEDRGFVETCFDGAAAAYLVVSADHAAPDFRRAFADIGANYAGAAKAVGLPAALFLSTIGTHSERYRGFIMTHRDVERVLDGVAGLDVLHLRSPNFFENLFYFLPASQTSGTWATPLTLDAPLDMAANADVAALALQRLLRLDFTGKSSIELHGLEALSMRKIAGKIADQLGRPLAATQVDREADIQAMLCAGMQADFANLINDTWGCFSRHGLLRAAAPQASTTATTSMASFLRDQLVPALREGLASPPQDATSTTRRVIVRYRVKADRVAENEALILAVFADLQGQHTLQYASLKLQDGRSFVHIAQTRQAHDTLGTLSAFKAFSDRIGDRCDEPPVVSSFDVVGDHGLLDDFGRRSAQPLASASAPACSSLRPGADGA